MDNREGLAVGGRVNQATERAEPEAALGLVEAILGWDRVTLGADKGYDRKEFIQEVREHQVTPHIARKQHSTIEILRQIDRELVHRLALHGRLDTAVQLSIQSDNRGFINRGYFGASYLRLLEKLDRGL